MFKYSGFVLGSQVSTQTNPPRFPAHFCSSRITPKVENGRHRRKNA
jgi:hypothetical protein